MAATPARALAGVVVMGLGVTMAYGAFKNRPVFGPTGLLTEAIKTGKLQAVPPSTPAPSTTSKTGTAHATGV